MEAALDGCGKDHDDIFPDNRSLCSLDSHFATAPTPIWADECIDQVLYLRHCSFNRVLPVVVATEPVYAMPRKKLLTISILFYFRYGAFHGFPY